MQNKSNLNINNGERSNVLTNNSPAEEFSIESAPIHSMKKDLEMIKNPAMIRQESAPLPVSSNLKYTSSPKISSFPKISPFLEKANLAPTVLVSQKKPENMAAKFMAEQLPEPEKKGDEDDFSRRATLKKVFVFSIIFLSVIALGIGSYYFWLVRGKSSEPLAEEPEVIIPVSAPVEEPSLPVAVIEPEIKTTEPKENTLVLDLGNLTSAEIKIEIKNQIEKLSKESFNKPVEFKLRDSQNNLINFSSFAEKSGLTFTQNLLAYLGESFSLFAFNDGPNLGTGLIVESKNDSLLTQEIRKEEAALPKDLDVLFLPAAPKEIKKVSFSSFGYKDMLLRYFNLISQEKLSIDYAVVKNKFIIGTTRNTLTALYDWLLLSSETK
jgi:hypothetical protein